MRVSKDENSFIVTKRGCKTLRLGRDSLSVLELLVDGASISEVSKKTNISIVNVKEIRENFIKLGFLDNDISKKSKRTLLISLEASLSEDFRNPPKAIRSFFENVILSKFDFLLLFSLIISFYYVAFIGIFNLGYLPDVSKSKLIGWTFVAISLIFHEYGHIVSALSYGAVPEKVGIGMRYGVLPSVYVLNNEVYHLSRIQKVWVHFSGVLFALPIVMSMPLINLVTGKEVFSGYMIQTAALVQLFNIIPLYGTDGFHILKEIAGAMGIKINLAIIKFLSILIFVLMFIRFIWSVITNVTYTA